MYHVSSPISPYRPPSDQVLYLLACTMHHDKHGPAEHCLRLLVEGINSLGTWGRKRDSDLQASFKPPNACLPWLLSPWNLGSGSGVGQLTIDGRIIQSGWSSQSVLESICSLYLEMTVCSSPVSSTWASFLTVCSRDVLTLQ